MVIIAQLVRVFDFGSEIWGYATLIYPKKLSHELISGVNGGYYPLQVRSILTNGFLGFMDMPLLHYLVAFLIKFISFFGFSITDTLIINVVKIFDSFTIPLLLILLYIFIGF